MSFPTQRCCAAGIALLLGVVSNVNCYASNLPIDYIFDSSAVDVPVDLVGLTGGAYYLQDDWSSVADPASFVSLDSGGAGLITIIANGSGTQLDTGVSGLGVDDTIISAGESIDIIFNDPVILTGISTNLFGGTDTVFWQIDASTGGVESSLFGDDGDFILNVALPVNQPLTIGSVNGDFALQGLSVIHVPEPELRFGLLAGMVYLMLRYRKRR